MSFNPQSCKFSHIAKKEAPKGCPHLKFTRHILSHQVSPHQCQTSREKVPGIIEYNMDFLCIFIPLGIVQSSGIFKGGIIATVQSWWPASFGGLNVSITDWGLSTKILIAFICRHWRYYWLCQRFDETAWGEGLWLVTPIGDRSSMPVQIKG